jgi:hypothetical protein
MSRQGREKLTFWALLLGLASLPAALLLGWLALPVAALGFGGFTLAGLVALRERSNGVPALAPRLRNAACVACDEAMLGLMQLRNDAPRDSELEPLRIELERALERERDPASASDPLERRPPPLVDPQTALLSCRGQQLLELRAESGWAPASDEPGWERWVAHAANRELRAVLLRHPGPERPWLICLHGYRMGQPGLNLRLFDPLRLHRALGLNLLVPVLPLHGARRAGPRSGDLFLDGHFIETRHALCQSVWDLRRLVGWARAQGAPAVGVYGVSLGALCAALLASVEPELDLLLLGTPLADVADVLWRHAPRERLRSMERAGLSREKAEEWLAPVTPLARAPKLPPERVAIYAATGDRIVPPAHALRLQERWGHPRLEWLDGGHLTVFSDARFRRVEADALAPLTA